jgi:hypothetical protein
MTLSTGIVISTSILQVVSYLLHNTTGCGIDETVCGDSSIGMNSDSCLPKGGI